MKKREKISQKICREVLQMIKTGQYPSGSKLPTEMELAAPFGVESPTKTALAKCMKDTSQEPNKV
ncbi:GntR family transcriptional regulator [Brevibacillus ruminantium]|uniref:GntR family transcriptional regulator n=1 Tax=Brevibacillus ruminantium TaxID=2950604 RepID=A0ABY4WEL8_9BACL|nr:GntR family transcriptional regulator [Brevibacillus ruminantium]USG65512.1 GntR family transcriptional regulator [Brevibacillus ruminantium]